MRWPVFYSTSSRTYIHQHAAVLFHTLIACLQYNSPPCSPQGWRHIECIISSLLSQLPPNECVLNSATINENIQHLNSSSIVYTASNLALPTPISLVLFDYQRGNPFSSTLEQNLFLFLGPFSLKLNLHRRATAATLHHHHHPRPPEAEPERVSDRIPAAASLTRRSQ
jgi:hypothetical protein